MVRINKLLFAASLGAAMIPSAAVAQRVKPHSPVRTTASSTVESKTVHDPTIAPKRVWVRYAAGNHDAAVRSVHRVAAGATTKSKSPMKMEYDFPNIDSVVITATEAEIATLLRDPNVVSVSEDHPRYLTNTNTRHQHRRELIQWDGQATTYGLDLIQAREVWEEGYRGQGVTVCVIDTGFDVTHDDFDTGSITGETLTSGLNWTDDFSGHGKFFALIYLPCCCSL